MSNLKIDYKDDVLQGNRKYQLQQNSDGTTTLIDKTIYSQKGDQFGAKDINETNKAINSIDLSKHYLKTEVDGKVNTLNNSINTAKTQTSQLSDKVSNLATTIGNPNILVNGGFQVWQAGTNFSITSKNERYTADGWNGWFDGDPYKIGKGNDRLYMGPLNSGTTPKCSLHQIIEPDKQMFYKLKSETTLSFTTEILSSDNTSELGVTFGVLLNDEAETAVYQPIGKIKATNGATGYTKYTYTFKLPTTMTDIEYETIRGYQFLIQGTLMNNMYFKYIKLEYGSVATPFIPEDPATALRRCQRYYQSLGTIVCFKAPSMTTGSRFYFMGKNFKVTMRTTPKITISRLASCTDSNVDTGLKISTLQVTAEGVLHLTTTTSTSIRELYAIDVVADARI